MTSLQARERTNTVLADREQMRLEKNAALRALQHRVEQLQNELLALRATLPMTSPQHRGHQVWGRCGGGGGGGGGGRKA